MAWLSTPASLTELKELLGGAEVRLVAGGTDWFVQEPREFPDTSRLVDLSGVAEMKGVTREGARLRIGAGESMSVVASDERVRAFASCLAESAASVGSWQIRNGATLGGNLAGGSPAADTPGALCALEATVEILSPQGVREALVESLVAKGKKALGPDEALVAFLVPVLPGRVSSFGKVGSRKEVSIARLNLSASARCEDDRFTDARVFLGTLGSAGRRVQAAEKALSLEAGETRRAAFAQALAEEVDAAIPGRSTRPYKRSAVQALAEDLLAALVKKAQEVRA